MKIKSVVKVMNFHSLLRVDSSRRKAEHYGSMEKELADMMRIIMNNRNLKLDKLVRDLDPNMPVLRIYIGSDYGFCGNINSSITSIRNDEQNAESIVIGKKLKRNGLERIFLYQDEFAERFPEIKECLVTAVKRPCWSAVELVYNHYYNSGTIRTEVRRIYPLNLSQEEEDAKNSRDMEADYIIEGDARELLEGMAISYLTYEVKIAVASAYAAENLMRQNSTSESLKKIDEMEIEELRQYRRRRNMVSFRKTVDSYIKQKALGGGH